MPSKVKIITSEELEKMHTGSLMKRRSALLRCEESLSLSDRLDQPYVAESGFIEFKNTEVWKQSYNELKVVLSSRENVLNKKERKALRQEKAKASR